MGTESVVLILTQDKVVKHSVRYSTPKDAQYNLQVYIPKEVVMLMTMRKPGGELENGFVKKVLVTMEVSL